MLYRPDRRRPRGNWLVRVAATFALPRRERQLVELNALGMSPHLQRDLGLHDGRVPRRLGI